MWCTSSHRASPHVRRPRPNGPPCCRAGPRLGTRPSRSGPSGTWRVGPERLKINENCWEFTQKLTRNDQKTSKPPLEMYCNIWTKHIPPLPNAKVWKCCLNASKVQLVQVSVSCRLKSRVKSPRGPIPETESCGITGPESSVIVHLLLFPLEYSTAMYIIYRYISYIYHMYNICISNIAPMICDRRDRAWGQLQSLQL